MSVLQLESIGKYHLSSSGQKISLLSDLDFTIDTGLTALIGPSGGGKSTLLRLLNRLDDPTEGRIALDGLPLADYDPLQLRRRVALVAQKPFMFPGTVLENLQKPFRFSGQRCPGPEDGNLNQILSMCQLSPSLLVRDARTLSGGQQQRVSLARSLLMQPRVLLLDEPTSSLDRPTSDRLGETLRRITRDLQLCVVLVTHDLRLAIRVADKVIYLEDGRMIESGVAAEVLKNPQSDLLKRFLADPGEAREDADEI